MKNTYIKIFEDTLGLSLSINDNNEIAVINLPHVISKIYPESINSVIKPIENLIQDKVLKDSNIETIFLKKILITKYIYNLINPLADFNTLDKFIEKLQVLSNKTYEQDSCTMGFIIFKNKKDNIKEELGKLHIDYIPFEKSIAIENLDKIKSALKIVDSLSICFVVDASYKAIGLAKKRKSHQSISSIMSNRYQKENEALLKFNMCKYFINRYSTDELQRKEIDELEIKISSLKSEIDQLDNKINNIKKLLFHQKDLKDEDGINSELVTLFERQKETLTNLNKLTTRQIELLEKDNITLQIWADGLKKFLSEKATKNNQHIQFVQLDSNKIEWFINDSLICALSNGKWNIRNSELISHIILEFMLKQHIDSSSITSSKFIKTIDRIIPRFHILFNNIKDLSKKNIGALIILLEQNKRQKRSIYKELLNKGELDTNEFKSIIKTESNMPLNIFSSDNYLFELICSVDGAVILDRHFNIISFGEMINNSLETPPVAEAGSRTLAAAKASLFGLSIKVSEDGDISIFENGSPIIKL